MECKICLLDNKIPDFYLGADGICNFCEDFKKLDKNYKIVDKNSLKKFIFEKYKIKINKNNKYDCLVGISGGVDSCYTLYVVKKILCLNPLVIHYDDGWNRDSSVSNIKNMVEILNVDLETYVNDWQDMKKLYRAFFKAKVPDPGVPGDVGIFGAIFKICAEEKIKYIFSGQSFRTEGTQPRTWSFIDGTYVKSLFKNSDEYMPLNNFPNLSLLKVFYYLYIKRLKIIPILNHINYSKSNAKKFLKKEFKFIDYGGHHHENSLSVFINKYYNKKYFGFDRDIISLSALIRQKLITKDDCKFKYQNLLNENLEENFINYCKNKLEFKNEEWNMIMSKPNSNFKDYFTSYNILSKFKFLCKLLVKIKLLNPILYNKFVK